MFVAVLAMYHSVAQIKHNNPQSSYVQLLLMLELAVRSARFESKYAADVPTSVAALQAQLAKIQEHQTHIEQQLDGVKSHLQELEQQEYFTELD